MRIVRLSPQERVDVPDASAISFLMLGEFRRTIRGLFLGGRASASPTHDNFIIQGFAVEPSAVPDAIVTVRLVPTTGGGRPLAFAIGAEDLTSRIDHGQLIGGEDQAGNTEGNATATWDFTGQPLNTYRVQMRFTYTDGVNDNRAFWDESGNTEFISAVDTRSLPNYSLGISVSPASLGDDWIPLADVVWDGASIDAGDITDLRDFVLEGASPFDRIQQTGTGGMEDFDRSFTRESVGLNEIYPAMRAIMRQIQDIKGEDYDSRRYNWFGRVFKAPEGGTASFGTEKTKTMRSLDTVTFTLGDFETSYGDFNGPLALESCLQHIEDMGANVPASVVILMRYHRVTPFTWSITTSHTFATGFSLTIIGHPDSNEGRMAIDHTTVPASSSPVIDMQDGGTLTLVNLDLGAGGAPANDYPIIRVQQTGSNVGGWLHMHNCRVIGNTSASPEIAVQATIQRTRINDCQIEGVLRLLGNITGGSYLEQCVIEGLRMDNGVIEFLQSGGGVPQQIAIRSCNIETTEDTAFGRDGVITFVGIQQLHIENCRITHEPDFDGIRFFGPLTTDVTIDNVAFECTETGSHAVDNGTNLARGTGWGIFILRDGIGNDPRNIQIRGCHFEQENTIDAGGIYLEDTEFFLIEGCFWRACGTSGGGSDRYTGIEVVGSTSAYSAESVIHACQFTEWDSTNGIRTTGIRLNQTDAMTISGCKFRGDDTGGSAITGRGATHCAIDFALGVTFTTIIDCFFAEWEPNTANSRCVQFDNSTGGSGRIIGCIVDDCGGWPFNLDSGTWTVSDCQFFTEATGNAISVQLNVRSVVVNNAINVAGSQRDVVRFGAASSNCIAMGNTIPNGNINGAGSSIRGYGHAIGTSDDFNIVGAGGYT